MELFSMVAMGAAIPDMGLDLSIGSGLMALVALVFAISAVGVFHIYHERMETTDRRRTLRHLKVVHRPAFGAAH